jgi:hypothetical protein
MKPILQELGYESDWPIAILRRNPGQEKDASHVAKGDKDIPAVQPKRSVECQVRV